MARALLVFVRFPFDFRAYPVERDATIRFPEAWGCTERNWNFVPRQQIHFLVGARGRRTLSFSLFTCRLVRQGVREQKQCILALVPPHRRCVRRSANGQGVIEWAWRQHALGAFAHLRAPDNVLSRYHRQTSERRPVARVSATHVPLPQDNVEVSSLAARGCVCKYQGGLQ